MLAWNVVTRQTNCYDFPEKIIGNCNWKKKLKKNWPIFGDGCVGAMIEIIGN